MKTLEGLENYYNKELLSDLKNLEKDRRANSKLFTALFVVISVPAALIFYALLPENDRYFRFYVFGFGGFYILTVSFIFQLLNGKYKHNYKHFIIRKIISFIDSRLRYYPEKGIEYQRFLKSLLFHDEELVGFSSDDFVCGKLKDTQIQFSDICVNYDVHSYSIFRNKALHFYGLFCIADFNKHFKGKTIVLPKKSAFKKIYYNPSSFDPTNPLEVIKLDNTSFQKQFVVYGTNQIEARYILTTNLMEKILDFQESSRTKIQLSFVDSNVHIAIPRHGESFEPNYFSSIVNFESIKNYFEDLELAISIVDELNLNTRIWTKR